MNKLLEFVDALGDIKSELQAIKKSMEIINVLQENIVKRMDPMEKEMQMLKKENNALKAEAVYLKRELGDLRGSYEEFANGSRATEVELAGIPSMPGQNLAEIVIGIANQANIELRNVDLKGAIRTPTRNRKDNVIIAQFGCKDSRDEFVNKARKLRLTTVKLGITGAERGVYFNDVLSGYTKSLLFQAKQFKREKGWKYVWCKEGKVFLRNEEQGKAIRVFSFRDLEVLNK